MNKKLLKFVLAMSVLAGVVLVANASTLSMKASSEKAEDEITVDKTIYDFGTISQEEGKVSVAFVVTNNTDAAIVLSNVTASCGCTTPSWTKEPIEPGKTGEVIATYNPQGHPGPFDKSITIVTTGNPGKMMVRIKGTVE